MARFPHSGPAPGGAPGHQRVRGQLGAHLVAEEAEHLCGYINAHRNDRTPLHLSAYAMWRLNWMHPFSDGNGRTSRVFSYVVLCVALGYVLPGTRTIPDQIVANRKPNFMALEAADRAWKESRVDLSSMETLLARLLASQLTSLIELATGKKYL